MNKFHQPAGLGRDENAIEWAARKLYTLLGFGALPLLVSHLLWRGFRQPAYRQHWAERFLGLAQVSELPGGVAFGEVPNRQVLWIHAVSVGETRAAMPLVIRWLEKGENFRVVLTHTTPTGRETGADIFSRWRSSNSAARDPLIQRYLPYDFPWANSAFLSWASPTLGVLMETELWPNLLAQAQRRDIAVVLINARLSPRSARRLSQFSWLARPAVARLTGIAAQTESDAQGFLRMGDSTPRVEVVGLISLRRQELDTITQDRSTNAIEVLLGDSLGDMFAYLCFSDLVLMGGSIPALGGQNPIEACAVGRPVFFGPNMFNFQQIARLLRESGAGCEVSNYGEWITRGIVLLGNSQALEQRSQASREFARHHRGATSRTDEFLTTILRAGH